MKKTQHIFECMFTDIEILNERVIDEAKNLKEFKVKLRWQQADKINSNSRLYTKSLLQRTIEDVNSRIKSANMRKSSSVYGMPFHPADGVGKLTDVSHIFTKVWMEEDGSCWAHALILANALGDAIRTLYEKGPIGVSSRGFGTMTEKEVEIKGNTIKYHEINDDYHCETPGDFVIRPSVKGAGTYESYSESEALKKIQICESRANQNTPVLEKKEKTFDVPLIEFNNLVSEIIEHEFLVSFPDANFLEINTKKAYKKYVDENWMWYAKTVEEQLKPLIIEKVEKTEKDIEHKMTEEDKLYNRYLMEYRTSGGKKTFDEYCKLMKKNNE